MATRSKRNLLIGIAAIALGVLYGGLELWFVAETGEPSEYFNGWWLPAFAFVYGGFMMLHYCSVRVRRLSRAIAESPYYKTFWLLASLALASLGAWFMLLVGMDFDSVGALTVFGLGVIMAIVGVTTAGLWFRRLRRA